MLFRFTYFHFFKKSGNEITQNGSAPKSLDSKSSVIANIMYNSFILQQFIGHICMSVVS